MIWLFIIKLYNVYMDLSDIRKLVAEDMPIDDTELDIESMTIPQLHNKYLNIYLDEKLVLQKLNNDYYRLKKTKWEYYTGNWTKTNLRNMVGSHSSLKF